MMKEKSRQDRERASDELSMLRRKIALLEEAAVQQSRMHDHYRSMYEESIDGYVVASVDGCIQEHNSAFGKMVGYSAQELKNMNFLRLTPAKWHDMENKIIRELISSGNHTHVYEKEYIHKDGHIFPVELRTYLIIDSSGELRGMWALVRDITGRKQAEESLRLSEIKFRTLYDSTSDAVILLDRKGFFDCNKAALAMFGLADVDELLTKKLTDLSPGMQFHGKTSEELGYEMITAALKQGSVNFEWLNKRLNTGEVFPSDVLFTVMKINGKSFIQAVIRDITARKKAENSLRESESRYKAIFENTGTATVILEEDKTISLANTEFEKLTGYSREEIEGKKAWTEFVVKEDLEKMKAQHRLRRIDASAAAKSYEFQLIDRSGRIKDIHLNIDIIPGTKKSVASLLDITNRKQAEEALQESQQRLSDIIDFLPDATFVIDKEGKVIAWNRAMEEMTGIKAAHMLGNGNYEYALPFYGERRPILIDLVLKPARDVELKYSRTDRTDAFLEAEVYLPSFRGKEIYLFGKASILRDPKGAVVGAVESIRDVTVAKRAEESLKYSEERFSKAFHMSPIPTVITTVDTGKYIDVNDSFLRMMGCKREEVIGRTADEIGIWANPENRRNVIKKLMQQGFLSNEIFNFRTKTGEFRDSRVFTETIVLNGRKFYLFICYDITDQEKLEAQLRQAQKMEAIGTLAGGIAHDFNNILGAIMGYTEMAQTEPGLNDRSRRYLANIFKASERARDLVKQILTFSRKSEEKLMPLRVSPIIKETLKLLRASLPSTLILNQNIRSEADTVFADPTQIHQILMNLCTNAAYAMPDKKGEIAVSLSAEKVEADTVYDLIPGNYLKLEVKDTGQGMDAATMGRIFDPFFTTKNPGEGTGLGLSLVYGIVKSYRGAIAVKSEPGKGTEFSVYLPLLMEEAKNQEAEVVKSISGGKECILFVDDEEVLVELGKSILTGLGYEVVGKTDSTAALEIFRTYPDRFNLVITDMTMPKMTGMELAKVIMQTKPDVPVIICTGFSETVTLEGVKSAGIRDLIMKPFARRRIAEAVRKALDDKD